MTGQNNDPQNDPDLPHEKIGESFKDCPDYQKRRCPLIKGMVAPFDHFCEWMRKDKGCPRGYD
jgi:hypothetical protein